MISALRSICRRFFSNSSSSCGSVETSARQPTVALVAHGHLALNFGSVGGAYFQARTHVALHVEAKDLLELPDWLLTNDDVSFTSEPWRRCQAARFTAVTHAVISFLRIIAGNRGSLRVINR